MYKSISRSSFTDEQIYEESLKLHEKYKGVLEVASKIPLKTIDDLSTSYTPGVAEPCREIANISMNG